MIENEPEATESRPIEEGANEVFTSERLSQFARSLLSIPEGGLTLEERSNLAHLIIFVGAKKLEIVSKEMLDRVVSLDMYLSDLGIKPMPVPGRTRSVRQIPQLSPTENDSVIEPDPGEGFGSLIRRYRERIGLNQAQMARKCTLDQTTINRFERRDLLYSEGPPPRVQYNTVRRICAGLGFSPLDPRYEQLMTMAGIKK